MLDVAGIVPVDGAEPVNNSKVMDLKMSEGKRIFRAGIS